MFMFVSVYASGFVLVSVCVEVYDCVCQYVGYREWMRVCEFVGVSVHVCASEYSCAGNNIEHHLH